jgi:hypothetical protein
MRPEVWIQDDLLFSDDVLKCRETENYKLMEWSEMIFWWVYKDWRPYVKYNVHNKLQNSEVECNVMHHILRYQNFCYSEDLDHVMYGLTLNQIYVLRDLNLIIGVQFMLL